MARQSGATQRTQRSPRRPATGRGGQGRKRSVFSGTREGTQCRYCRNQVDYVDYKDIGTLQKLLTNRGKIYSRKRSGNCAGCQRKVKRAIKRARYMALLPFTT
ncbi:MAG: 30S ribosomal protein S18 [Planctomycetes bacterium]|nr:30S ribosomal protein S18 [Planctomycetota bacterium]